MLGRSILTSLCAVEVCMCSDSYISRDIYENRVQMCTVHSVNMITFCSSVIETLQYPMNIAAEHVGLIVDLAESCSQD